MLDILALRGLVSHLVWGAWIEILMLVFRKFLISSRTSYGVRGLKYYSAVGGSFRICRTSYGVRGLKLQQQEMEGCKKRSHLVWGAWIEIEERGHLTSH